MVNEGREVTTDLEYRALSWLHDYFSGVDSFERSLPRPLAYLAGCHGILTEYVSGQPLSHRLLWRGNALGSLWSTRNLHSLFRTCGRWLRALHAADHPGWMPVRTPSMEALQARAHEAAAILPDAVRRRIPLERLLARIPSSLGYQPRLVVSHNDYHPANVLFYGAEIRVLDLVTVGLAPAEDDLASFLVRTLSQKQRMLAGELAGPSALWRSLAGAFLTAYGRDTENASSRLAPFLTVQFLERLASASSTAERLAMPLRLLSLSRLSRWAREFSTSLEEGRLY
jgi:aminoglycoside phosphotransferase (APT) family kinase protein